MIRLSWPKTPTALLEARSKAFVDHDVDFIVNSVHADVRDQQNRDEIATWSKNAEWLGLEIEKDWEDDEGRGFVQFTCRYREQDQEIEHKEIAEFRKADDEKWYYYDSKRPSTTVKRETPKIGRNDPCPCGSGKKYKKCCAA